LQLLLYVCVEIANIERKYVSITGGVVAQRRVNGNTETALQVSGKEPIKNLTNFAVLCILR